MARAASEGARASYDNVRRDRRELAGRPNQPHNLMSGVIMS